MHVKKRVQSVQCVFASLFGESEPVCVEEDVDKEFFRIVPAERRCASVRSGEEVEPTPTVRSSALPAAEWVDTHVITERGVLAAVPSVACKSSATLSLDRAVASGHPGYWMANFIYAQASFNPVRTPAIASPAQTAPF